MGQKVHPYILRIGFGKNWQSKWFVAKRNEFAQYLDEDLYIRELIKKSYVMGSISDIIVERVSQTLLRIRILTSRPGVIIGRRGQDIERLKARIAKIAQREVVVDVEEVQEPSLDAQLVAEMIAFQITKRVNFRRAMKRVVQQALNLGCEGVKVRCKGRLGGVEIARAEGYKQGKIPLQTFRADIDYGFTEAKTTYGKIGVKVWFYKGVKKLGAYMKGATLDQEQEVSAE